MIATIILILITLIITLDSLGSKRIRARVIKKAKSAFEEALNPPEKPQVDPMDLPSPVQAFLQSHQAAEAESIFTLRMKLKGAVRRNGRPYWVPLEGKLFVAPPVDQLHFYQDRTLWFLLSRKTIMEYSSGQSTREERLFSLIPLRTRGGEPSPELHYWSCLPWIPELCRRPELNWSTEGKTKATFYWEAQKEKYRGEMTFGPKHNVQELVFYAGNSQELILKIRYEDLHELDGKMVPLKMDWQVPGKEGSRQYQYTITEVVYNEAFAWW